MKRVLLKLSGEYLASGDKKISFEKALEFCTLIKKIKDKSEIVIVVGGGNLFRGRDNFVVDNNLNTYIDTIGMMATVMNAFSLHTVFASNNIKSIVNTPFDLGELNPNYGVDELKEKIVDNIIIIGGGLGKSGYSTDTASSYYAKILECDTIIKLTNVEGVYDKDPNKNIDAKMYSKLTFNEAIDKNLKVMDKDAFIMCRDNDIEVRVISFLDKNNLIKLFNNEEVGTVIYNE